MENKKLCTVCPRGCKVNRDDSLGFCQEKLTLRIAKIIPHFMWEEPCLAGKKGTLAIFFSGCNLMCDYCQNHQISRGGVGKTYTIDEFVSLIESMQKSHDSIDLITPTHFSQALYQAFKKIKKCVPVIYNTNGFETEENINKVSEFVDVFLTDFKYSDNALAQKFSHCNNYFQHTLVATKAMCKQKPDKFKNERLMQGVIIRHLVLPGFIQNSLRVLDCLKQNFPERLVSIMSQFTPNGKSEINRKLLPIEYKTVLAHMEKLNITNGFLQDFESACNDFVPNFEE